MTFTPGPWTLAPCSHGGAILVRGKDTREHPQSYLQIVPKEDAHLIAAAPDLYAAIKEYLEWGAMTGSDRELFRRKFVDALARAEGR